MHKLLLDLPNCLETKRCTLRPYQPGDGALLWAVSQRNRAHLQRFESGNVLCTIQDESGAEIVSRQLAIDWAARDCFFMGAFNKTSHAFVAQIYIGVVSWELPEFEIGYFVDVDHEGQGYVSEAVTAALGFIFDHLGAQRVRLMCDETNLRSQRVAERCGFRREAFFREQKRQPDGSLTGTLVYGMIRSEYAATKDQPPGLD